MLDAVPGKKEGVTVEKDSSAEIVPPPAPRGKNPRRVAAGKLNHSKRRGFTPQGLVRLREAAFLTRPWERATGPRTIEGKARSARNWHAKRAAVRAYRDLRQALQELTAPSAAMRLSFEQFLAEVGSNSAID